MNLIDELWKAFVKDVRAFPELMEYVGERIYDVKVKKDETDLYLVYGLASERVRLYIASVVSGMRSISDLRVQLNVWDKAERSSIRITNARDVLISRYKSYVLHVSDLGHFTFKLSTSNLAEEPRFMGYVSEFMVTFTQET